MSDARVNGTNVPKIEDLEVREKNPFTIEPIRKKEEFIGRENLIFEVKNLLSRQECCHIVGERKSGKTSFLYRIAEEFEEGRDMKFVFLDMQRLKSYGTKEILGRIAHCIDPKQTEKEMGYREFENFISDKKVILALDEISALLENKKVESDFPVFLRSISSNFDVVFLTTHRDYLCKIAKKSPDISSPFFNIFLNFPLKYFTEEESKELIRKGGEEFLNRYEKWILERAYYHPFLLQTICSKLFEYYKENRKDKGSIFLNTEKVSYAALEDVFDCWYDESSENEKIILKKIISRKGRIFKDEERIAENLERRLLIHKTNNRYHLVSPFFKKEVEIRKSLEDGINVLERMALPEPLPLKFKAKERRDHIFDFIEKGRELCESEGYFGIGGFISFDRVLKRELKQILGDIKTYIDRQEKSRPINIFIQAPPGSGKSFLVNSFVEELVTSDEKYKSKLTFLEVNLSNISSYSEIIFFFDTIAEEIENEKIPFVLFDEIDAEMPGFNFYQRMLMPMWDGAYLGGRKYKKLPSAVFFFAGTSEGLKQKAEAQKKAESTWRRVEYALKDIIPGHADLIAFFSKLMAILGNFIPGYNDLFAPILEQTVILYQKVIGIEYSRTDWRKNCQNELESLAEKTPLPKFRDFYERLDHFIFLPPITLYFKDLDDDPELYFTDRETIYLFVTKIRKASKNINKISKEALAILCSKFYRSRRAIGRAIFLSRIIDSCDTYSLGSLPRGLKKEILEKQIESLPRGLKKEILEKQNYDFSGEIKIR